MKPPNPMPIQGARRGSKKTEIQRLTSDLFVCWCVAHGLPKPEREYEFARANRNRRWRFDYAWVGVMLNPLRPIDDRYVALEVEGGAFTAGRHTRGAGFVKDLAKYNAAALDGWTVLRYTPQQLTTPQTLQDLKQALGIS